MRVPRDADTFDVYEAKTHPSEVLKKLKAGKQVTITRDGSTVATLVPVRRTSIPKKPPAEKSAVRRGNRASSKSKKTAPQ